MGFNDDLPNTEADALARGFKHIQDLDSFLQNKLGIGKEEFENQKHEFAQKTGRVTCTATNVGAQCFSWCYPDGTAAVGFCQADKSCKLFEGTCTPY